MRLVSVNVWCGVMFDALADWAPGCGADVLCLQEVTRTPGQTGWVDFADADRQLSQRADLFADLQALLPDHQGFFVANDAGPVVDRAGITHVQQFGLAVFVADHVPVVGQATSWINQPDDGPHLQGFAQYPETWPNNNRPRLAQGLRVYDSDKQRPVAVFHTHGLRDPAGKHDTDGRRRQAENLAALVDGHRLPGDLTVVAGDFNLLPTSETFEILGRIGLVELVGDRDTRTSRYTKPVRHANYLLVSAPNEVRDFQVPATPEVSDHRMLVLDL